MGFVVLLLAGFRFSENRNRDAGGLETGDVEVMDVNTGDPFDQPYPWCVLDPAVHVRVRLSGEKVKIPDSKLTVLDVYGAIDRPPSVSIGSACAKMPNLTALSLRGVQPVGLADATPLLGLKMLAIRGIADVDQAMLNWISSHHTLTCLEMSCYDSSSDLVLLGRLTRLEHLSLQTTFPPDLDVDAMFGPMTLLRRLFLNDRGGGHGDYRLPPIEICRNLEVLMVFSCNLESDSELEAKIKSMSSLKWLDCYCVEVANPETFYGALDGRFLCNLETALISPRGEHRDSFAVDFTTFKNLKHLCLSNCATFTPFPSATLETLNVDIECIEVLLSLAHLPDLMPRIRAVRVDWRISTEIPMPKEIHYLITKLERFQNQWGLLDQGPYALKTMKPLPLGLREVRLYNSPIDAFLIKLINNHELDDLPLPEFRRAEIDLADRPPIFRLPDELLVAIAVRVGPKDAVSLSQTCVLMRNIALDWMVALSITGIPDYRAIFRDARFLASSVGFNFA